MEISRPQGLLAGFHAVRPDDASPELGHAGEQWALRSFHIRRHSHPAWELFYQVDGWSVWEDENGGTFRVDEAGLLAMPPGLVHWLVEGPSGSSKQHFIYAMIDIDAVVARHKGLEPYWAVRVPHVAVDAAAALAPLRQLIREVSSQRLFRSIALTSAIDAVVIEATRLFAADAAVLAALPIHPAVAIAQRILDEHCERTWTLAQLGEECGVSPNHLAELFSRDVGIPPRQYLLRARMNRAVAMLSETEVALSDLAIELGFSSSQHFATTFKRFTGLTPKAVRLRGSR